MPRGPRLETPGALHHGMVRGLERRALVRQAAEREDILTRLAGVGEKTSLQVLAWALLPNHVHLLERPARGPWRPPCGAS